MIIKWLVGLAKEFGFGYESLFVAIRIVDRVFTSF